MPQLPFAPRDLRAGRQGSRLLGSAPPKAQLVNRQSQCGLRTSLFLGSPACRQHGQASHLLLAILGTFLLVAALAWYVQWKTRPAPLNAARIAERKKYLAELRAAEAQALNNYGWVDQSKGLVRLPISRAMELVLEEWKQPALARSNLAARAEQAQPPVPAAPAAPATPAAPNPFE